MIIAVINKSTKRTNIDVGDDARAVDAQFRRDFCPAWGLNVRVYFFPDPAKIPTNLGYHVPVIQCVDTAPVQMAAGAHGEDNDTPDGFYAVNSPIDPCTVLSHECMELARDLDANEWWDGFSNDGSNAVWSWAAEVGDPVQDGSYQIAFFDTNKVLASRPVSNFVFPAWKDPQATAGPYDQLGVLTAPFTLSSKGYAIVRTLGAGSEQPVFGPGWPSKVGASVSARMGRRMGRVLRPRKKV